MNSPTIKKLFLISLNLVAMYIKAGNKTTTYLGSDEKLPDNVGNKYPKAKKIKQSKKIQSKSVRLSYPP